MKNPTLLMTPRARVPHQSLWTTSLFAILTGAALVACSGADNGDGTSRSSGVRLAGATPSCKNVQEVCLLTEPPQCYEVCADEGQSDPSPGCKAIEGNVYSCDDSPCVVGLSDDGVETQVCYPPDCTVSFDGKTETIECPTTSDPGPGCSEPNPGPGGTDPGTPASSEGSASGGSGSDSCGGSSDPGGSEPGGDGQPAGSPEPA